MDPSLFRQRAAALHVIPRQDDSYRGGWPLGYIGSQCPTNTPVICKRDTDEEPQGCCPQGQFCKTTISEVYCCPSEADCGTAVTNRPVCANPAWTLFGLTSNRYFCCPAGYFGVKSVELSGRGLCEVNLDGLPTTRIASTITRGTPATTGTVTSGGTATTGSTGQNNPPGGASGSTGTGTASNNNGSSGGGGSVSTGVIAGSVVGGVVLLLLGIALILWLHRRSLRRDPGPGAGPIPTPRAESEIHSPPSQSMASTGMVPQHQHQHPHQFVNPAIPTPPPSHSVSPPPQYMYPQPPEAGGIARVEMPVYAQELSGSGPTVR